MSPGEIDQLVQKAVAHHQAGRLPEAEILYRQVLSGQPGHGDALHLLGVLCHQTGRGESAIELIRRALGFKPDWPEATYNLGLALSAVGRLDDAIAAYRRATQLDPNFFNAWNSLGNALRKENRPDEAITAYRRVASIKHENADVHFRLANALLAGGWLDDAIASYHQAILLRPDFAAASNNLGNTLLDTGQAREAMLAYRRAVELEPDNSQFHSALAASMFFLSEYDGAAIAQEHFHWNARHAQPFARLFWAHQNDGDPDRRLRIGYLSRDFCNHPVGRFLLPVIERHDREQFEIYCYSDVRRPDGITARIQFAAAVWRDTRELSPEALAKQIRSDRIDILIDLAGHTTGSRLLVFARKPAPIQMAYLGYPGTTGLTAIDYRFTDALADPAGTTEQFHCEKLIRLPGTSWCFTEPETSPPIEPPPVIRNGHITFGSFNNLAKVTDDMLGIWCGILQSVPDSKLMLKAGAFSASSTRNRVQEFVAWHGIEADRLILPGPAPDHHSHLASFNRIDIALDTFPYHGTATTCDALWMGAAVITLVGPTHVSRVGLSLLSSIGLGDLAVATADQYVRTAVEWAAAPHRLNALRLGMRERMRQSPLMDAAGFALHLEAAFRNVWRQECTARHHP